MKLDPNFGWETREGNKLTNKQVEEILLSKKSNREIAKQYNCSERYVRTLKAGRRRTKIYMKLIAEGKIK